VRDKGGEALFKIIGAIFVFALLIGSMFLKYDCCREQGYSHDECVYDLACNS